MAKLVILLVLLYSLAVIEARWFDLPEGKAVAEEVQEKRQWKQYMEKSVNSLKVHSDESEHKDSLEKIGDLLKEKSQKASFEKAEVALKEKSKEIRKKIGEIPTKFHKKIKMLTIQNMLADHWENEKKMEKRKDGEAKRTWFMVRILDNFAQGLQDCLEALSGKRNHQETFAEEK